MSNAREIAKNGAFARFEAMLEEKDFTADEKRGASMGFLDGHKAGFRASSGSVYVALNSYLEFIKDDSPISEIRTGLAGLRDAVRESAR